MVRRGTIKSFSRKTEKRGFFDHKMENMTSNYVRYTVYAFEKFLAISKNSGVYFCVVSGMNKVEIRRTEWVKVNRFKVKGCWKENDHYMTR